MMTTSATELSGQFRCAKAQQDLYRNMTGPVSSRVRQSKVAWIWLTLRQLRLCPWLNMSKKMTDVDLFLIYLLGRLSHCYTLSHRVILSESCNRPIEIDGLTNEILGLNYLCFMNLQFANQLLRAADHVSPRTTRVAVTTPKNYKSGPQNPVTRFEIWQTTSSLILSIDIIKIQVTCLFFSIKFLRLPEQKREYFKNL